MAAESVHPYMGTGFIVKGEPFAVGFCENPVAESEGASFKDVFNGEPQITFTVPSNYRPIKGNRRQRKAAAFANNKTIFGLMEKYTARSQKADRKREKLIQKKALHALRSWAYVVQKWDPQKTPELTPTVWLYWREVKKHMKYPTQKKYGRNNGDT